MKGGVGFKVGLYDEFTILDIENLRQHYGPDNWENWIGLEAQFKPSTCLPLFLTSNGNKEW